MQGLRGPFYAATKNGIRKESRYPLVESGRDQFPVSAAGGEVVPFEVRWR